MTTLQLHVDATVRAGRFVVPDRWIIGGKLREAGDGFSTYRLPTHNGGPIESLACEVRITGRKIHYTDIGRRIRCRITFPGDGEPDVTTGGWMFLD